MTEILISLLLAAKPNRSISHAATSENRSRHIYKKKPKYEKLTSVPLKKLTWRRTIEKKVPIRRITGTFCFMGRTESLGGQNVLPCQHFTTDLHVSMIYNAGQNALTTHSQYDYKLSPPASHNESQHWKGTGAVVCWQSPYLGGPFGSFFSLYNQIASVGDNCFNLFYLCKIFLPFLQMKRLPGFSHQFDDKILQQRRDWKNRENWIFLLSILNTRKDE